jgi:RecB family exonuclease
MQFASAPPTDLRRFMLPSDWVWHASHIKSYQTCAYQFAWEYLAKPEEVECWGPAKEAWFGTALHAALEWLYIVRPSENEAGQIFSVFANLFYDDAVAFQKTTRDLVAAWAARRGLPRCAACGMVGCPACGHIGYVIPRWKLYGYASPDEAVENYIRGIGSLRQYINSRRDWLDPSLQTWPEHRFSFSWKGRLFEGTMDRIDHWTNLGLWKVVDYKTGLRDDVASDKHSIQKWLYTLGVVAGVFPDAIDADGNVDVRVLDRVQYEWENTSTGQKDTGCFSEKEWKKQQKIVLDIITSAEAGNFQPSPTPLCGWCRILSCPMRERDYLHA